MKPKVAVLGAQGYVGQTLVKLLHQHPQAELTTVFSRDAAWDITHDLPELQGSTIAHCCASTLSDHLEQFDTLFLATPPEISMALAPLLLEQHKTVIDMSGAFRLKADEFNQWYNCPHTSPALSDQAIYGLSPWWQKAKLPDIPKLISNPGCYATCALMSLLPLLKSKLIKAENIIIDAKSGVSGAGKKAVKNLLFCEIANNFYPYKITTHQHIPEIIKYSEEFVDTQINPTMMTHMLPIKSGISMSIYADLDPATHAYDDATDAIVQAYANAYQNYELIHFGAIKPNQDTYNMSLVALKQVVDTAKIHLGFLVNANKIFISACIDNLYKGAASQAIENFNSLHHLPLEAGLIKLGGLT